jgi:hypothetical protein
MLPTINRIQLSQEEEHPETKEKVSGVNADGILV